MLNFPAKYFRKPIPFRYKITFMRTLQVTIPDDVFGVLSSFANRQDEFVPEAIQEKLERESRQHLKELLAEGYKATAKENLVLTKEFEAADLENL
jgi:hypothetical protein